MNQGSSILCEVCERPRLATRPPVAPLLSSSGSQSDINTKVCLPVTVLPAQVLDTVRAGKQQIVIHAAKTV